MLAWMFFGLLVLSCGEALLVGPEQHQQQVLDDLPQSSCPQHPNPPPVFRFAEVFQNSMVLQSAPLSASIWGYAEPHASVSVMVGATKAATTAMASGVWRVTLPPQPSSLTGTTLKAMSHGQTIRIDDVLFGDIWLCSVQVCVP